MSAVEAIEQERQRKRKLFLKSLDFFWIPWKDISKIIIQIFLIYYLYMLSKDKIIDKSLESNLDQLKNEVQKISYQIYEYKKLRDHISRLLIKFTNFRAILIDFNNSIQNKENDLYSDSIKVKDHIRTAVRDLDITFFMLFVRSEEYLFDKK